MSKSKKFDKPGNLKSEVVGTDIDNPHYDSRFPGAPGNPMSVAASINMRESPAALWFHRYKSISQAQLLAADKFRRHWEMAGGAGASALDYTIERVDSSRRSDPISERQLQAVMKIEEARRVLGPAGYHLIEQTCGQCLFLKDLFPKSRARERAMRLCKDMLDLLAVHYGYKSVPIRSSIRAA